MKPYGVNELRKMFLDFFIEKGHDSMNSFSLVPQNDKSLLLINSGMAPLKPYFTGQEIPPNVRVTTCQKCIRTGDIENVGKTARHGTFFEMLGNFSFGDYFKKEAISWAWEFFTENLRIPTELLHVSVYEEDEETRQIWLRDMGIAENHIHKMGKADNFWEHGAGPCGPCTEIYFDRGEKYGCGSPDCTVGCECDRYIEVWNIVFTQFEGDGKGKYEELDQKNIDTGMGLERLAAVLQQVDSIFDVDTVKAVRDKVCHMSGVQYGSDQGKDVSVRLITDHIRSATFMISDGIMPSNEGREYVLRRLIRRAARHGSKLGIQGAFLAKLCQVVIDSSSTGYPELSDKREYIIKVLQNEEEMFQKTIKQGLTLLKELEKELQSKGKRILDGQEVFKLYDTYGFPLDLTKEILEEDGIAVDEEGYQTAMAKQRETARNARHTTNYMGADANIYHAIDPSVTTEFDGYSHLDGKSNIIVLTTEDAIVEVLNEGDTGTVFVDKTPFYATMGGQIHDTGRIESESGVFIVTDCVKLSGGKYAHIGQVEQGKLKTGDTVELKVDGERRNGICKNHSATHLLQKALRNTLGSHVEQKGSYVDEDRLRFDFAHFQAMTAEEVAQVENEVNREIAIDMPVETAVMTIEEAKQSGAMALFGEKYDHDVRVVTMGDYSKELCGGTHVSHTGSITTFKILSEAGVASGVRRIEAITGQGVFVYYEALEEQLRQVSRAVKTEPSKLVQKVEALLAEVKNLQSENEQLKGKLAKDALGNVLNQVIEVKGVKLLAVKLDNVDGAELRNLGDDLKAKIGEGVILLVSVVGNQKVNLLAMATDEAVKKGAHAGNLIKSAAAIVGGGGGGRPNMAQAGGKNPAKAQEAVDCCKELLEAQL